MDDALRPQTPRRRRAPEEVVLTQGSLFDGMPHDDDPEIAEARQRSFTRTALRRLRQHAHAVRRRSEGGVHVGHLEPLLRLLQVEATQAGCTFDPALAGRAFPRSEGWVKVGYASVTTAGGRTRTVGVHEHRQRLTPALREAVEELNAMSRRHPASKASVQARKRRALDRKPGDAP